MDRWLVALTVALAWAPMATQAQDRNLEALDTFLTQADEAIQQQDYIGARSLLRDALAVSPRDATATGFLRFVQGELDQKASVLYSVATRQLEADHPRRAWLTCQAVVQLQDLDGDPYHRGCQELAERVWSQLCGDLPDDNAISDARYWVNRSDWLRAKQALAGATDPRDPRVFLLNSQIERELEAMAHVEYRRAVVLRALNAWSDAHFACERVQTMVDSDNRHYQKCETLSADLERESEGLGREIRRQECERNLRIRRYVNWRRDGNRDALFGDYSSCAE